MLLLYGAMTRAELLPIVLAARTLITDPAKWTTRNFAQDVEGRWAPVGSERAVAFDLKGALVRVANGAPRHALAEIMQVFAETSPRMAAQLHGTQPLTREQALEMLDRAIEHLSRLSVFEVATQGHDAAAHIEPQAQAPSPLRDASTWQARRR